MPIEVVVLSQANAAEDTVARLSTLFEIVAPTVVEGGGHVNEFLGDGALAVFGAPNDLTAHTVAALDRAAPGLVDRGSHALNGKSAAVRVFGLES